MTAEQTAFTVGQSAPSSLPGAAGEMGCDPVSSDEWTFLLRLTGRNSQSG